MGSLLILAIGAAIGGVARVAAPRRAPRRADVALILPAVGAALGTLGYAMTSDRWTALVRFSPGTGVASALGAMAILGAFHMLPLLAPRLLASLPGREDRIDH